MSERMCGKSRADGAPCTRHKHRGHVHFSVSGYWYTEPGLFERVLNSPIGPMVLSGISVICWVAVLIGGWIGA